MEKKKGGFCKYFYWREGTWEVGTFQYHPYGKEDNALVLVVVFSDH